MAIAIIQARMSSSRLPGKVMMDLAGRPIIWHIWNRARKCKEVERVVVATSEHESDDLLEEYCKKEGICCVRGPLDNVLERFMRVVEQYPCKYIVRITGDCPLIYPEFIDAQIKALRKFDGDTLCCDNHSSVIEGQGVMSLRALKYVCENSDDKDDLEHVGSPFIAKHPECFRIVEILLPKSLQVTDLRLTVDEPKDYELFKTLFEALWKGNDSHIDLNEALIWLKDNPHIAQINAEIKHKPLNVELNTLKNELHKKNSFVGSVEI